MSAELVEDGPGPEGLGADELAALGVLDRPGHDLGRAGGPEVDEDGDRDVDRLAARLDGVLVDLAALVALLVDDAVLEELAGDVDRLADVAAGLPRRSRTIPVAPAFLAATMASSTSLAEPAENSSRRRSARVVPGIIAQDTAGTVTFSRTML